MSVSVTGVRKSNMSNNVLHSSNEAIVAYCDTEEEAEKFINAYNEFKVNVEQQINEGKP